MAPLVTNTFIRVRQRSVLRSTQSVLVSLFHPTRATRWNFVCFNKYLKSHFICFSKIIRNYFLLILKNIRSDFTHRSFSEFESNCIWVSFLNAQTLPLSFSGGASLKPSQSRRATLSPSTSTDLVAAKSA